MPTRSAPSRVRQRSLRGPSVATGVCGIRYHRQIELSTVLTDAEKGAASQALDEMLEEVRDGQPVRLPHDYSRLARTNTLGFGTCVRAAARACRAEVFTSCDIIRMEQNPATYGTSYRRTRRTGGGTSPPHPEDLCKIPILATCPEEGVVLDPFCGTGTTNLVAFQLGRKSVGIDISPEYLRHAKERCRLLV